MEKESEVGITMSRDVRKQRRQWGERAEGSEGRGKAG